MSMRRYYAIQHGLGRKHAFVDFLLAFPDKASRDAWVAYRPAARRPFARGRAVAFCHGHEPATFGAYCEWIQARGESLEPDEQAVYDLIRHQEDAR